MIKKILALGTGWNMMQQPESPMHDYILSLADKEKPLVLFLPTASGDNKEYTEAFYRCYTEDKCVPSDLRLFNRVEEDLRSFILKNDIIHVGGGNTANMIAIWKVHGVSEILKEAWAMGKVLCGGSAGAICWFESGVTDSFGSSKLAPLTGCLGLIKGSICPHYDVDGLRRPTYHDLITTGSLPVGYAVDDEAALYFEDSELKEVVTTSREANAYAVTIENGKVYEQTITTTNAINRRILV